MNKTFKIIGINPKTNRQYKKRVYTSEVDYLKYKDELIKRYSRYLHVKSYELIKSKWVLLLDKPFITTESNEKDI